MACLASPVCQTSTSRNTSQLVCFSTIKSAFIHWLFTNIRQIKPMHHCQKLQQQQSKRKADVSYDVSLFSVLTQFTQIKKSFNNEQKIPAHSQLGCKRGPIKVKAQSPQPSLAAEREREREQEWDREMALMNWKISYTDYLRLLCLIAVWERDHHQAGSRGGGGPRRRAVQSSLSENVSAD